MKIGNRKSEIGKAIVAVLVVLAALLTISVITAQTVRRDLVVDGNGTVVAPSGFWATNAAGITNAVGTNYATRAQGLLAASALQTGTSWTNISGLGSAATNAASAFAPASGSTNYATAAQGALAASALQTGTSWTNVSGLGSAATNAASAFAPAVAFAAAPATNSAGTPGTFIQNGNYLYICTATNTWRRIELLTW